MEDSPNGLGSFNPASWDFNFDWKGAEWEARWKKVRRTYADYREAYPLGDLCQRCAGIDWSYLLLDDAIPYYCGNFTYSRLFSVFETSQVLATSSCSLCRLLSYGENFEENPDRALVVCCTCNNDEPLSHLCDSYSHGDDTTKHSPFLSLTRHDQNTADLDVQDLWFDEKLYPGGLVIQDTCSTAKSFLVRKLDPGCIDYGILQSWLEYCKSHHTMNCNRPYESTIPGLRVIDCSTKQVVVAPRDTCFQYLTLSYVWGSTKASRQRPASFPVTIRDAITVTLELGYRYLWIDQFCINQQDASHKQAQIQLMGRIYAESQLVIIAAAGDSSNHGLPGVDKRPRRAQMNLQVDNVEIIKTLAPRKTLTDSTWASRGWTHQEGYLAPRRLIFTESEVVYVCEQASWQESALQSLHNGCLYLRVHHQNFPTSMLGANDIFPLLSNYSSRKLSFESDIINGCAGLLNKVVNRHFWGMPVLYCGSESRSVLSLYWRSWHPGQRRAGFPSWSWVSTTGPKKLKAFSELIIKESGYITHIRAADGSWRTLDDQDESRYDVLPAGYGPTLRMTGTFYTASVVTNRKPGRSTSDGSDETLFVTFRHPVLDDFDIAFELHLDAKSTDFALGGTVKAVAVAGRIGEHRDWLFNFCPPIFMVLQAVKNHYKRVGITGSSFHLLEKKTGLVEEYTHRAVVPHPACRGGEEIIYIE